MNRKLFLIISVIALSLRFVGIYPGYPDYHTDESFIYDNSVKVIISGSIKPSYYVYGFLPPLINSFIYKTVFIPFTYLVSFLEFKRISLLTYQQIFGRVSLNALYWSRFVSSLFGFGTVLLTFFVAKKLFNPLVGAISFLLMAVNYRQVLASHFGLPDIYNAFFYLLAFFFLLRVKENSNLRNYIALGICMGLVLSVKFQVFIFIPFLFLNLIWTRLKWEYFFASLILSLVVFAFINPYLLINYEEARSQLFALSLKYKAGRFLLDFYPLWYLYRIGIGPLLSFFIILGTIFSLFNKPKQGILLLSLILPFVGFLVFYSGGGIFIRNFIGVIPFLIILGSYGLSLLVFRRSRIFCFILVLIILICSYKNLLNSLVLVSNYSKPWNVKPVVKKIYEIQDAKIAAYGVPSLPIKEENRIYFDPNEVFSVPELSSLGADYIILNTDWLNNYFYDWIGEGMVNKWHMEKPDGFLSRLYYARATKSMLENSVFRGVKPWQAPDSNFIISSLPKYELLDKGPLLKDYSSTSGLQTEKENSYPRVIIYWQTELLNVQSWGSFSLEAIFGDLKKNRNTRIRDGYLYADFYKEDSKNDYLTSFVGRRIFPNPTGVTESLFAKIPRGTKYAKFGFQVDNGEIYDFQIKEFKIYKSSIKDNNIINGNRYNLDPQLIFPYSVGNM